MRKLIKMELAVVTSAILLVISGALVVIMAKVMANLFFVMYSDAKHPWITEVFLSGSKWGFFVPLVPGIPAFLSWRRGRLEQDGPVILPVMHAFTRIASMVVAVGIIMPLLYSNWGMTGQ
jgi:hypothetical protein